MFKITHQFKYPDPPLYPEIDYKIVRDLYWEDCVYIYFRTFLRIHRNNKWYKVLVQTSESSHSNYDLVDLYNRINMLCYTVARFYKPRPEDLDTDQRSEKERLKALKVI